MNTAKFSQRVSVIRKVQTTDADGDIAVLMQNLGSVWANLKFLSGSETIKAGVVATNAVSVRVRKTPFTDTITANDLLEWENKPLNIKAVLPDLDSMKYIDFVCEIGIINSENAMG